MTILALIKADDDPEVLRTIERNLRRNCTKDFCLPLDPEAQQEVSHYASGSEVSGNGN